MTGDLVIDNQQDVRFREATANGTNYAAIQAPATLGGDYTLTLPIDDGASGELLTTDGSGVLSWISPVAASSILTLTTKTANYTATTADQVIRCDASGGEFTITLYTAVGNSGRFIYIKNVKDSGNVIVDANGSQTIDDELTQTLTPRVGLLLISNGTNWDIY